MNIILVKSCYWFYSTRQCKKKKEECHHDHYANGCRDRNTITRRKTAQRMRINASVCVCTREKERNYINDWQHHNELTTFIVARCGEHGKILWILFSFIFCLVPSSSVPLLVLSAPNLVPELLIHFPEIRVEIWPLWMFRGRTQRGRHTWPFILTATAFRRPSGQHLRRRRLRALLFDVVRLVYKNISAVAKSNFVHSVLIHTTEKVNFVFLLKKTSWYHG